MSRTKRDAQQLMHWCKNGDLVLKNKIKDTLLRENVHEDRFLDSTLSNLNKHNNEEQRHLVNKRLQFAKRRQRSLEKSELQHFHLLERHRSFSDGALHLKGDQKSHKRSFNAKLKWQKAISVVRFVVQSKSVKKKTRLRPRAATFLPSIAQPSPKSSPKLPRRNANGNTNHLILPRIAPATTESKNCLEDPRFLRLQQILSLDENKESGQKSPRKPSKEEDGHGSRAARLRSQTFHL
jgi:hypothetical protein